MSKRSFLSFCDSLLSLRKETMTPFHPFLHEGFPKERRCISIREVQSTLEPIMCWKWSASWTQLPCGRISSCLEPWRPGSGTLRFEHLTIGFLQVCRAESQFCSLPHQRSRCFSRDPRCGIWSLLTSSTQFVCLSVRLPRTWSRPLKQGMSWGLLQQWGDRLSWQRIEPSRALALPGPLSPGQWW